MGKPINGKFGTIVHICKREIFGTYMGVSANRKSGTINLGPYGFICKLEIWDHMDVSANRKIRTIWAYLLTEIWDLMGVYL